MYARQIIMELRPDKRADFSRKIESEILPLLRKQKGFQDEITFVTPEGPDAFAVSLWDSKESAEAYGRAGYAEVSKLLAGLIDGNPRVHGYEVANSTCHKIAANLKAA